MRLRVTLALLACVLTIGACVETASAARRATGPAGPRIFTEYVAAPAQFDLSLAEISFRAPARLANAGGPRRYRSALRIALRGTAGLNYLVAAVTRYNVHRRPRVLVLVVNRRPRGSLAPDLARVGLRVTAARRLGAGRLFLLANPLTRPAPGLTPALCDLPIRGRALTAGDLRAVLSHGAGLGGFSPAAAVAQAYDVVCAQPYSAAFRQAVTQGSSSGCEAGPAGSGCCVPNAVCVPPPAPPPQPPPPCPPCPCPSRSCPLAAAPGAGSAIACWPQSELVACPL
ncbi:MAG TPA: hypothetical protein VN672_07310 [Solirubrobacteraceae bacterium]|nr:hypothetical protein [Solirubrobacteraceae bacterium]